MKLLTGGRPLSLLLVTQVESRACTSVSWQAQTVNSHLMRACNVDVMTLPVRNVCLTLNVLPVVLMSWRTHSHAMFVDYYIAVGIIAKPWFETFSTFYSSCATQTRYTEVGFLPKPTHDGTTEYIPTSTKCISSFLLLASQTGSGTGQLELR